MATTIGLVGLGAMGARVGGALVTSGVRVVSVLSDRTAASRDRAIGEGIVDVADLATLVGESTIILSIVPPGVASTVANEVVVAVKDADEGERVFVDCNAISPGRSRGDRGTCRCRWAHVCRWRSHRLAASAVPADGALPVG